MFDAPRQMAWEKYKEWAKQYGASVGSCALPLTEVWSAVGSTILSFRVLSQTVIVITSKKVADALLNKRSEVYSDRPVSVMDQL